jgi:O-antigen ligase
MERIGAAALRHRRPVVSQQRLRSTLGWWLTAALLAVVVAGATYLDVKMGFAAAIGLGGLLVVLQHPPLLAPVAIVTVCVEGIVVSGVAVTRLLAPCALLLVLAELLRGGARIRVAAPLLWAAAYTLWAFASALWTTSLDGTRFLLQSLLIALIFMLLFAALVDSERTLSRVMYVFAFTAGLIGGLSVLAFGSGTESFLGLELTQAGRSQGLVDDPDFFAAMQLVAVPLVLVLANETSSHRMRLALYMSLFAILASVFTSLSRGAFLALLVLALLLVATKPQRLFQSRRQKALTLLVASFGMVLFFSRPYVRGEVVQRAESIYAPKNKDEASGAGRTNLWKAAEKITGEHPLTGIGYGSFIYVSEELLLRTPGVDPLLLQNRNEGDNFVAHNTYLGTSAELGITGLILLVGLMISAGATLRATARRAQEAGAHFLSRVSHALFMGLCAWAVTSIFLSGETARMLWIIVGLSLALAKLVEQHQRSHPAPS